MIITLDAVTTQDVSLQGRDITATPSSLTINSGSTGQLTASTLDDAGNKVSLPSYELGWSSENTAVATVDSNGLVTGISGGSTTITATYLSSGKTASATVTIGRGFNYVTIDFPGATITYASSINNAGQIVGRYVDTIGSEHMFLATPQ